MQKKILILMVLTIITGTTTANASSIATITALDSPVWLVQDNSKTELGRNSILKSGDNISTGDAGLVEMKLWVNGTLQLNSNSQIIIRDENGIDATNFKRQPELYIHQGRACINYTAQSASESKLKVNIGNTMFAAIPHHGDICVFRRAGLSSIKLRAGNVQITHPGDLNLITLSEAGAEFHIEDGGSYKLLITGDELSILEIEKPFSFRSAVEEVNPIFSPEIVDSNDIAFGELTEAEFEATSDEDVPARTLDIIDINKDTAGELKTAASETTPKNEVFIYNYTVYLFSTRDEEIAGQINRRFQKAGYDTQVFESTPSSILHYRVAAPGFKSKQEARKFSDSIVGRFGVTETWIGKALR
jgi:hypothetical protein